MAEQPTNLSDYELQRLAHIRRNHEFLVSLGLADAAVDPVEAMRTGNKKKPSKPRAPRRPKIAPPPDGFPDCQGKPVLFNAEGQPDIMYGRANGAIIETCFDHDKGTLSFGINGGPLQRALDGFPDEAGIWIQDGLGIGPAPADGGPLDVGGACGGVDFSGRGAT